MRPPASHATATWKYKQDYKRIKPKDFILIIIFNFQRSRLTWWSPDAADIQGCRGRCTCDWRLCLNRAAVTPLCSQTTHTHPARSESEVWSAQHKYRALKYLPPAKNKRHHADVVRDFTLQQINQESQMTRTSHHVPRLALWRPLKDVCGQLWLQLEYVAESVQSGCTMFHSCHYPDRREGGRGAHRRLELSNASQQGSGEHLHVWAALGRGLRQTHVPLETEQTILGSLFKYMSLTDPKLDRNSNSGLKTQRCVEILWILGVRV